MFPHFAGVTITAKTEVAALNARRRLRYDFGSVRRIDFCSMGMITERKVGRFCAEDDPGNPYTVVRW
jgi:hypothetical protein